MLSVTLTLGMLLASPGVAVQDGGAAEKQFQEFEKAYAAEMAAFQEAMTALQASDDWKKAMEARDNAALQAMYESVTQPDAEGYATKAMAAAEKYKGEPGAFLFLRWTLTNAGTPDRAVAVLQHLTEDHLEHEDLGECVDVLARFSREQDKGPYMDFLAAVIEESPNTEVQATAYFVRGQYYGGGDEDLKMCVKLAPDSIMAMRANAAEFERTRLQIGMEAPDIVGPDLDGVEFKLSDYRGKVVVIDFWGDW